MEKIVNRALVLTLIFAIFFGGLTFAFRNAEHDTVRQGEREFPLCEYINVNLQRLPVTVIPYDDECIRVSYKNDLPLDFTVGDNRLSITESEKFVVSLFTGSESEFGLYIYLPDEIYREITLYTGSGGVKIGRVDSRKLSVITESGDIMCENMITTGKFTTTSGFISLDIEEVISGTEIFSRKGDACVMFPSGSSVAVDFKTQTGQCVTDLWGGQVTGSYLYGFNGGGKLIEASLEKGILTIYEKG